MLLNLSSLLSILLLISSTLSQHATGILTSNVIHKTTARITTVKHQDTQQTRASLSLPTGSSILGPFANQTGLEAANACWSEWDAYSASTTDCPKATSLEASYNATNTETSVIYETYKLCDGHPRANATESEWVSRFTGREDGTLKTMSYTLPPIGIPISTRTTTDSKGVTFFATICATPAPTPKCTIDGEECLTLFSEWTAGNFSRLRPPCTVKIPSDPCDDCGIYIPSVKLMYFPVTMTGDFCGDNYSTVTPTSIGNFSTPNTVEVSGTTFTSGYAYLSYAGVTAGKCGTPKPAGVLAVPSSELFSYRGLNPAMPIAGDKQWPFDFADLAPNPVPWDAWISQDTCVANRWLPQCQTITQGAYRPGIVYPRAFWSMEPEWSKCGSGPIGIVDPPTALPTANGVAMPTTPNVMSTHTTPAAPKMDPTSGLVKPTADPPKPSSVISKSAKGSSSDATYYSIPPASNTIKGVSTNTRDGPAPSHSDFSEEVSLYTTVSGTNVIGASSPLPQPYPQSSTMRATSSVQDPTTVLIPTSIIGHEPVSLGTLAIVSASQAGAISVGTHLLSVGQATTLGGTVISLGSQTLVASVSPGAASPSTATNNALSVLEGGQTQGSHPLAKVTLDGQTLTAYSGGMVAGAGSTVLASPSKVVSFNGQTISFVSGGVVVGSSSYSFQTYVSAGSTQKSENPVESISLIDPTVAVTYGHGASETTVYGHTDAAGNTIISVGFSMFTYSSEVITEGGLTFTALSGAETKSATGTAAHTLGHSSINSKLPSIQSTKETITSAPSSISSDSPTLGNGYTSTSSISDATPIKPSSAIPYTLAIAFMLLVNTQDII